MNTVIKPTFNEALKAWHGITRQSCTFKSWIKPRFNFWKLRQEFYFHYKPLVYKTMVEVDDELFTIGLN